MQWKVPDLGEGILEGEIVKWLVREGDLISEDQHLVEFMTDKATLELPIPISGTIKKIFVKEGEIVKVGQTLAEVDTGIVDEKNIFEDKKEKQREIKEVEKPQQTKVITREGKALASPSVRALARKLNVDIQSIEATGPHERVTQADVERAARGYGAAPEAHPHIPEISKPPIIIQGEVERIQLRGLRRKIAERMTISQKIAAHFTHIDEVDLTELKSLKEKTIKEGVKLTYLTYFVKAAVEALKKHPDLNASLDDENNEIIIKKYYNIGIAVATENGLIVPVIKNVDKLSLVEIAKEISRLGDAARNGKIALDDLKGGNFTLTNIGSIGGILSVPIINYPEVAIMGLHTIEPTPVVRNGNIVIRDMMNISISADHRVVDGAHAALFCNEFISLLENPTNGNWSSL